MEIITSTNSQIPEKKLIFEQVIGDAFSMVYGLKKQMLPFLLVTAAVLRLLFYITSITHMSSSIFSSLLSLNFDDQFYVFLHIFFSYSLLIYILFISCLSSYLIALKRVAGDSVTSKHALIFCLKKSGSLLCFMIYGSVFYFIAKWIGNFVTPANLFFLSIIIIFMMVFSFSHILLSLTKILIEGANFWKAFFYGFNTLDFKILWVLIIPTSILMLLNNTTLWVALLWLWPWSFLIPAIICRAKLAKL